MEAPCSGHGGMTIVQGRALAWDRVEPGSREQLKVRAGTSSWESGKGELCASQRLLQENGIQVVLVNVTPLSCRRGQAVGKGLMP